MKAAGIWLIMVVAAILNGLLRDYWLVPLTGDALALPLSGILLSVWLFLIAYFSMPFIGAAKPGAHYAIGLLWVVLTWAFEYLFGHYVAGKSWHEINQVFHPASGDLFLVVLIVTAIAPRLAARLREKA